MVKVRPATSAAALERTPIVTSAASHTTPRNVAKSPGCAEVCAVTKKPPPIPATNAPAGHDDLHLHDADAERPGARRAPTDGVERQPRGRAPEIEDEQAMITNAARHT
jgi:hypothetical protein